MIYDWVGFFLIVALLLYVDLKVVHRKSHVIAMPEAIRSTIAWIAIGLSFSGLIYLAYEHHWGGLGESRHITGLTATSQYLTAYLVEKSLSIDNIFVIAMLFRYFKVPPAFQHRVLYAGIIGAIVFRGIMIGLGAALLEQFDWIFYIFGAILVFTSFRMIFGGEGEMDLEHSRIIRWTRKLLPITDTYDGQRFTTVVDGRRVFTMLTLVLIAVEAMDVVFAVDSIPAIFGFTEEAFIVMTSNIFAILGLRSLYFVVAGAMTQFRYLKVAVSVILMLVGIKMFVHDFVHIEAHWSLLAVVGIIAAGVYFSLRANRREAAADKAE